jgi:hypothetical protein
MMINLQKIDLNGDSLSSQAAMRLTQSVNNAILVPPSSP